MLSRWTESRIAGQTVEVFSEFSGGKDLFYFCRETGQCCRGFWISLCAPHDGEEFLADHVLKSRLNAETLLNTFCGGALLRRTTTLCC
jgi:hypothetical protein